MEALIIAVVGIALYLSLILGAPVLMTRKPAGKILKLIRKGSPRFEIHSGVFVPEGHEDPCEDNDDLWYVDYTIVDTVTGKVTYIEKVCGIFSDSLFVNGDLFWMNDYEGTRLYHACRRIIKRRNKASRKDKRSKFEIEKDEARKVALETYKDC
ncbi:hypothetical protein A71_81 [Escherichia phage A7_1]|uniref:Uncharacterized protein n=2 Tax=Vequintavirinae TaxID=1911928 RepID=A0AAE9W0T2_9CAUD|nr:hypothetical protein A71_81 [Escherichia phage A7_1]UZZ64436.1 hypothetical protein A54_196 [Escherichia phage A5-4]WBF77780.1 hypothetical protein A73_174 [Escherichia phage A73]WBF78032.1 hypothetical protein W70_159 [Escherichia phage W70]